MKKSNKTNHIRSQEHKMCERRDWGVIWISHAMKPPSAPTPAVQTPQTSTRLFPITRTWWVKSWGPLSAPQGYVPLLPAETGKMLSPTSGDAEPRLTESLSRTEFWLESKGRENSGIMSDDRGLMSSCQDTPDRSQQWISVTNGTNALMENCRLSVSCR